MKYIPLLICSLISIHAIGEDIIVTNKLPTDPSKVGSSVTVVAEDEIDYTPYQNLTELLQTQPGVTATNTGGVGRTSSLRIRGEDSYRTKVYIDGIRIDNVTAPQAIPQIEHILLDNIDRIEILRGPQGLVYGADAGGVVSLKTADPEPGISGQVGYEVSRFDTKKTVLNVGYGSDVGGVSIQAVDFDTEGFNARSDDASDERDGYENTTASINGYYQLTDTIRVRGIYRDVEADDEFDNCGFPSTNDCQGSTNENIWRLSAELIGESSLHEVGFSRTSIDRNTLVNGAPSFDTAGNSQLFDYTGRFDLTARHGFLVGAELYRQDAKTAFSGFESDLDEQYQQSVFGEWQYAHSDQLYVSLGARYDDNDAFGEHVSYRLTSAYTLPLATSQLTWRVSAGTGFRAPSLSEVAYPSVPPATRDLKEETSKGYDVAVAWQHNEGASLEAIYFEQTINDEIFFDLETFSGYLQASGESESKGVELIGALPLTEQLNLNANYMYNDTKNFEGETRALRPRHTASISANYWLNSQFVTRLNWQTARDISGVNGQPLEDYKLLDASIYYYPTDHLNIYLKATNLLDEDYEQVRNYNTAGANVALGVKAEF